MGGHLDDAENKKTESHMRKHWVLQHDGVKTDFSFEILSFHKSALDRHVAEAVRISRTGASKILNSKNLFNRSSIPRVVAQNSIEEVNLGDREQEVQP